MKKQQLLIVAILAIILGGVGVFALTSGPDESEATNTQTEQVASDDAADESTGSETVDSSEDGKVVTYTGVAGEDALTTLRGLAEVVTEDSDFGAFVTTINGIEADSNSEFWAFYVDGKQASVGADSFEAEGGEEIEWRLESF